MYVPTTKIIHIWGAASGIKKESGVISKASRETKIRATNARFDVMKIFYKKHYANSIFLYNKPILVIANKYNIEWGEPPINFLSIEMLDAVIEKLKHKYQI